MSKIRYFTATDGKKTVFRASPTRVYLFGGLKNGPTFSTRPAVGLWPVVEVSKAEYDRLVALKVARINRRNARLRARGKTTYPDYGSPWESWIDNADLAPEISEADIDAHIARLAAADLAAGIE